MHVVCTTDRSISDKKLFMLLAWKNIILFQKTGLEMFLEERVVSVLCASLGMRNMHRNDTPVTIKLDVKFIKCAGCSAEDLKYLKTRSRVSCQ